MKRLAAIVLAAGRSQRMGAFKPLLPFGERTVIESCLMNLQAAGLENIIVVLGHRAEEVRARLAGWPVKFALNAESHSEMGVSIARGLELLPDDIAATLITPADLPAVPPSAIRAVIETWQQGARLVIPEYEGRGGHPVLLALDFRAELLHLDAQRGLRGLFETHSEEVRRAPVASPNIRRDMDTWKDYCALHEEICGIPPPSNVAD